MRIGECNLTVLPDTSFILFLFDRYFFVGLNNLTNLGWATFLANGTVWRV